MRHPPICCHGNKGEPGASPGTACPPLPSPPCPSPPRADGTGLVPGGPCCCAPPPTHGAAPAVGLHQHRGPPAVIPVAPGLWHGSPFPSFPPPPPPAHGSGFLCGGGVQVPAWGPGPVQGGSRVPVGPSRPRRAAGAAAQPRAPRRRPCSDSRGGGGSLAVAAAPGHAAGTRAPCSPLPDTPKPPREQRGARRCLEALGPAAGSLPATGTAGRALLATAPGRGRMC